MDDIYRAIVVGLLELNHDQREVIKQYIENVARAIARACADAPA